MALFRDITRQKFGRWTILSFSHRKTVGKYNYQMWNCECVCGNKSIVEGTSLKKGNSLSCGCLQKEAIHLLVKENSTQWKGDQVGYFGLHYWIRKTFGKADRCENKNCSYKSNAFQWALIKGKEYERKRENFMMLCRPCHSVYDNISRNLSNSPTWLK